MKKKVVKKKGIAKPYTAKFTKAPLTDRQIRVVSFVKKHGPCTLEQIADGVFTRERPKAKRLSWTRNQLRNIRANRLVKHTPRRGEKPAMYAASALA